MTSTSTTRVLPVEDDRDTSGFWEAARQGRLAVRVCDRCGQVLHLPRAYCHYCGSWEGSWKVVRGTGRLHSWTVVEHQVHPSFPVPYTIILVDLDDNPFARLVGYLDGAPDLYEGQPMRAWFEELDDGTRLPQWQPADRVVGPA
jgi:uncharacterized OB-fold protein